MNTVRPVGDLLREWRQRRRLSQLDLSLEAEISARHLSFLETGRSQPSREMVLHLAEQLDVPLRDRNILLQAAGYAPVFPERPLDDPALQAARLAIDQVLTVNVSGYAGVDNSSSGGSSGNGSSTTSRSYSQAWQGFAGGCRVSS